jgi:hypothetical protein
VACLAVGARDRGRSAADRRDGETAAGERGEVQGDHGGRGREAFELIALTPGAGALQLPERRLCPRRTPHGPTPRPARPHRRRPDHRGFHPRLPRARPRSADHAGSERPDLPGAQAPMRFPAAVDSNHEPGKCPLSGGDARRGARRSYRTPDERPPTVHPHRGPAGSRPGSVR